MYGQTIEVRPEDLDYDSKSGLATCKEHRDGLAFGCPKCRVAAESNAYTKQKPEKPRAEDAA